MLLGSRLLIMAGLVENEEEAGEKLVKSLSSGEAFKRFERMVSAQGGDVRVLNDFALLPLSEQYEYKARESGYINQVDAQALGMG